ncbi:MAG: hypothetical protein Q9M27_07355 [Mariprofundaceae bacterium]|jgi:hypothetical protein|nr:hypothetical protein [Mariprofundaceae bacterium]
MKDTTNFITEKSFRILSQLHGEVLDAGIERLKDMRVPLSDLLKIVDERIQSFKDAP